MQIALGSNLGSRLFSAFNGKMAKPDAKPRLTRRQAENSRAAIKTTNIITRMQQFVMAEPDENGDLYYTYENGKKRPVSPMTREQLQAGNTLLSKALPDLKSIEHTNPEPELSREEIEERLQTMLQADPTLVAKLLKLSMGKIAH